MKVSQRQFVRIAALLPLLAAYIITLPHFTPPLTIEVARAAMAEAGVCAPDAPITQSDGKVYVSGFYLSANGFTNPDYQISPPGRCYHHGDFYYEPLITSWLPGGRWKVSTYSLYGLS